MLATDHTRGRPRDRQGDRDIGRTEEWLVQQAQGGHTGAFGDLARRHETAALRVATVVLGTSEGAEDVVQLAMERAWRSMQRFDGGREFRPWFLRIVANAARNDRRSRGRRARLAVRAAGIARPGGGDGQTPEDAVTNNEERRVVVEALNRLEPGDRLVIALRHFEHMSEREMAEVLGCAAGTVKSRLSRAMNRLRQQLIHQEVPDG